MAETTKPVAAGASGPAGLDERIKGIAVELRCLVCQNQTIADSTAPLALDLKQQIREQLLAGKTDAQVREYMTQRYGDFVLYRPPVKPETALLWAGPALLAVTSAAALVFVLRRRQKMPAEAFEPDADTDDKDTVR